MTHFFVNFSRQGEESLSVIFCLSWEIQYPLGREENVSPGAAGNRKIVGKMLVLAQQESVLGSSLQAQIHALLNTCLYPGYMTHFFVNLQWRGKYRYQ